MTLSSERTNADVAGKSKPKRTGLWILVGLLLGILCGVLFGEYCDVLHVVGEAYVGLLQMTVLPYMVLSLIAKTGRLDLHQAKRMGLAALVVLLVLWLIGVVLVVSVAAILPPAQSASFFSPTHEHSAADESEFLSRFVPTNIFRSLSSEYVPAVVLFCLCFGVALIFVPGKEPVLHFLDLCSAGMGRINVFLVRLAPFGLFTLTANAAGTMRMEELSRVQAYLLMFALACLLAAFAVLPLIVSSLTQISYRKLFRAAQEPVLTAIATGKLFVVLPQIVDKCEQLLDEDDDSPSKLGESTANVLVPLAYPFPHLGKILPFTFISFAAWYTGRGLTLGQTADMAMTGTVSSFASPLVSMPYLLDQYQLPQDLMALFILPGFITTRLADVVGVLHLMVLTLIVTRVLEKRIHIQWGRLAVTMMAMLVCLGAFGTASRWYLASTILEYDLGDRYLSLSIPSPYEDVVVHATAPDLLSRPSANQSTLEKITTEKVLRVGYPSDHLPYSFVNRQKQLVGLDVELMHLLAAQLQVRLHFVPYTYDTVFALLETGEIDLAVGGLIMNPQRLLRAGFTQPYGTATMAVVLPDHRRSEFDTWDDPQMPANLNLAVVYTDLADAARRQLPNFNFVAIESFRAYFTEQRDDLDGLIVAAEEGAAWNVLYPEYSVVIPRPVVQRPVSMAVRLNDAAWVRFLDQWLEFERLDGSLDRLHTYWVEGGGTLERPPRWCVLRDVLHWIP